MAVVLPGLNRQMGTAARVSTHRCVFYTPEEIYMNVATSNGCRLAQFEHTDGDSSKSLNTPLWKDREFDLYKWADNVEILQRYGQGMGSFAAMKDFMVYCCVQDSAEVVPTGYNSNAGVAVWGRGGKLTFGVDEYMSAIDALQPDWFQSLCDSDTDRTSSRKRVRKSVDRTLKYVDECIERQSKLPKLKNAGIIGVIEGGYLIEERLRSARETAKRPVSGFCIEGFHAFGPEMEKFRIDSVRELLEAVLAEIPDDKPRVLPGVLSPLDVIQAVKIGIDVFDSTYPYVATTKGSALVFDFDSPATCDGSDFVEISLKDDRYREDVRPLVENCACYTCTTHSRAYIHHLLNTAELLAGVLLMMHNFHHYFRFFEAIRTAIANNSMDVLERRFAALENSILHNPST